ncbi:hypothetical protein OTK49_20885 [Vibrio coralliirubri]|uniref:hypothetical protein n=1 Tax=Vibrio coralliirubri TaxID=1516159 RepID=UPI0022837738|nr:hypothetical protein [Vibrio coralliirubri]MCY9864975.1 hypothetical protein [Vibrio coralliirubri]
MKKFKIALPLLAATILAGCGTETIVKSISEKELENAQLLIIEPSKKSIFNPEVQEELIRNTYLNQRPNGVMLGKDGENLRPAFIVEIESRIAYVKELDLSKKAEKLVLNDLEALLAYHQKWLKFESSITDEMLWDAYSAAHPKVTPELIRGAELKAQYTAHIKPFEDAYKKAVETKKVADANVKAESEKIKDQMFQYVIDNSIPITRDKLSIFTASKTFSKEDGECPVSDFHTDIVMQTVLNKATDECEYAMTISNTRRGVSKVHQEGLKKVVTGINKPLSEAWIARAEARDFVELTERKLRNEKVVANNKYQDINSRNWDNKARRLANLSGGYFNPETFTWRKFGEKGTGYAAYAVAEHQKIDLTIDNYNELLNEITLYVAYNDLLSQKLNDAVIIDDIDTDGSIDIAKDEYVDAIKLLEVTHASESKSIYILEESKVEDDMRVLEVGGVTSRLAHVPIYDSKLDYQTLSPLSHGIEACDYEENKCLK